MRLDIKNSTEEVIREIARLTGRSFAEAVDIAALNYLNDLKSRKPSKTLEEHLAFVRSLQDALKAQQIDPHDTRTGRQLRDELYDEHGLPK